MQISKLESTNYCKASKYQGWKQGMIEEMNSTYKNKMWYFMTLSLGKSAISIK